MTSEGLRWLSTLSVSIVVLSFAPGVRSCSCLSCLPCAVQRKTFETQTIRRLLSMHVTTGEGAINGSAAVWVRFFAFICPITLDLWKLKCTILYCGNTSTTIIVAATIMHYTRIIMDSIIMKFPPYATNLYYTLYQLLTPTTPCGSKSSTTVVAAAELGNQNIEEYVAYTTTTMLLRLPCVPATTPGDTALLTQP